MSSVLRDQFRAALSPKILEFMDEIEHQSGEVIQIVHQPANITAAMSMRCCSGKIQIEIPVSGTIHEPAALHELQHMERYLVHEVPMTGGVSPNDFNLVGNLDNPIEHLVIVPDAERFAMRDTAFWDQQLMSSWRNIAIQHPTSPYNRQQAIRLTWMSTYLATDPAVTRFAEQILAAAGGIEERETRYFRDEVLDNLEDKNALAEIVTAALGIARNRVQLQRYNKNLNTFDIHPL